MHSFKACYNKSKFECTLANHVTASHRIIVCQRHGHCKSGQRQLHKGQCGTNPRPPYSTIQPQIQIILQSKYKTQQKDKYKEKQNKCARIYCKYANVVTWQGEDNAEIASQETGLVWGAKQKHANRFGTVCTHMGQFLQDGENVCFTSVFF